MKRLYKYFLIAFFLAGVWGLLTAPPSTADDSSTMSVTLEPGLYASVKGDADKFRAIKWMNDGYNGGLMGLTFENKLNKDTTVSFEGHTIPTENDNDATFLWQKGDKAFIKSEYKSFRKYYDGTGGVFNGFSTYKVSDLSNNQDLKMDMGHFSLQGGLGPVNDPDISLLYERMNKEGNKSMLSWTSVKEGTTTKKIGPAWESVNQSTDTIALKEKKKVAGVTVKGEQKAEFERTHTVLNLQNLATTGVGADYLIRTQENRPDAAIYSSSLRGEKWMLNDKTFASLGYLYSHINSSDVRVLRELTRDGAPYNFSGTARQSMDSPEESQENTHTWIGDLHTNLTSDLTLITKVKADIQSREANSIYRTDTTAGQTPDGIANKTDYSNIESKVNRLGETVSLRYSGITRTSLYAEIETQQTRDWTSSLFTSLAGQSAASSPWFEEVFNNSNRTTWTLGARTLPLKSITVTAQVRQRFDNKDYDNVQSITNPPTLLDGMKINTDEASTKVTWKPFRWLQSGLRYQYLNSKYYPRAINLGKGKNQMLSNTYTYDISMQPMDALLFMLSYSRQQLGIKTVAGTTSTALIPGFNSGVNSFLFSASYSPKENLTFTNSALYSIADNFDNYNSYSGLSFESAFRELDLTTGFDWSPKKDLKISPAYEYASYEGNPLVDVANYSAHIFMMRVAFDW